MKRRSCTSLWINHMLLSRKDSDSPTKTNAMRVKYRYNAPRNKAEIVLVNDDEDYEEVITVGQATELSVNLSNAIAMAFYDFTASTPNTDAPAQQRQTQND